MEEPDSKTLVALLKEKDKEVKNYQKKVKQLEDRYIQKHREYSDLKADREILISFVKQVLEIPMNKSSGTIVLDELEAVWSSKEEEKQRSIRKFNQISSEEIQKLKNELNKAKEAIHNKDMELKEFKSLEENYSIARSQTEELRCEIDYLEKEIESLRIENAKLKSNHDEVSKTKTEFLIAAMEQKTKDTQEESKLYKILADSQAKITQLELELKSCLDQQDIINSLEAALREQISEKDGLVAKVQALEDTGNASKSEFLEHRKKAQKLVMEKDQTIEKLKLKIRDIEKNTDENNQIFALKLRIAELEKAQSRENINMEYLKNIVMRFMEYMYSGNVKEANTLSLVLYTVLEFSNEEVEIIKQAKQNKYFLKGVKEMFTKSSPGVGVSHNTLHTVEGRKRINFVIEENKESS